jgi:hypothetical protein
MILDEKDKPSHVIYIPLPPSTHSLTKPKSRLEQKRKLVAQKASTSFFFIHNPFSLFQHKHATPTILSFASSRFKLVGFV